MKEKHHIITAQTLIQEIKALGSVDNMLASKKRRSELASLYRQVMNIGSVFPARKETMNNYLPSRLQKRVSRTCPACVKPDVMRRHIKDALEVVQKYAIVLEIWIEGDTPKDERKDSVHEMRPTKKD